MERSFCLQKPVVMELWTIINMTLCHTSLQRTLDHLWNQCHIKLLQFTGLEGILQNMKHLSMAFGMSVYRRYWKILGPIHFPKFDQITRHQKFLRKGFLVKLRTFHHNIFVYLIRFFRSWSSQDFFSNSLYMCQPNTFGIWFLFVLFFFYFDSLHLIYIL